MMQLASAALALTAVSGCKMDMRERGSTSSAPFTGKPDIVAGTYVTADSGVTLGKHWCYSGALVLDTTGTYGSIVTMCSDEGSPVTEHLKGSYKLRTRTVMGPGQPPVQDVEVVLTQQGSRSKKHTLLYKDGTLKFKEPWILGAGLRALEVKDPVLSRLSAAQLADPVVAPAAKTTAEGVRVPPPPRRRSR